MAAYKDLIGQKITKVTSNPSEPKTGQIWYNSTDGKLRGLGVVEAWTSTSPMTTAMDQLGGTGTQTAALAGAGGGLATFEEYNGSGWAAGGSIPTAMELIQQLAGTQTAAICKGGLTPPPGGPTGRFNNEAYSYDGSSWSSIPDSGDARIRAAGSGTQTAYLVAGGAGGPPTFTNRLTSSEEYDGSSWTEGGSMSTAREFLSGFGTQTASIMAGGSVPPSYGSSNASEQYDGTSFSSTPNLNTARYGLAGSGTSTSNLIYGGGTGSNSAATESYDGTSWSNRPSMGTVRLYLTRAGDSSSSGLASGGNTTAAVGTTEEFTASTNTITGAAFSSGGSANTARRQLGYTGAGTQNAFMVYGGFSPSGMLNASEEYGGATWTATPNLNTARGQNAGFGITTAAVACGGATPTVGGYTEEYNGSSWTTGNSMSTNRYEFGATGILTAGLALQGDQGPSTPFGVTCEEYDGTNWSSGGTASTARRTNSGVGTQTATITAGGQIPGPSATANVESYDGTSFSEVNNLNVARGGNAVMGGPAGATSSVITGGNVPTQFSITEQWNGTSMVTGVSMANDRSTHGAGGTSALGIVGLGQIGPSPPYGDADTEEYVGETSAANITDFTTS